MRFVLHPAALDGEDALLALIDRLVDRVADEVHRIEVPAADLLQGSRWYATTRPTRRKVLTSAIASPPRRKHADPRGPHGKRVHVRTMDEATHADRLAHSALVVLVEDREADGVLLDIFVEELGWPLLADLWKRGQEVTPRAIELHSAGGIGSMPQRIRRAIDDAERERRPLRLFVLCDRDARWPGDADKGDVQRVRDTCNAHGIPHHVLHKRYAESYIPDQVFEAYRGDPSRIDHVARFDALLRRSRAQRDHFPVKEGLSPREREDAIAAGLYDASERSDLALLEQRLFNKRPRPMLHLSHRHRAAFTAAGLRARDGNGEIDRLLADIAQEL